MACEPPISAEQWARLRRLDGFSFVSMRRRKPRWLSEWPRVWYVAIVPHDEHADYYLGVRVECPTLSAAVAEALRQAEGMRWVQAGLADQRHKNI